MFEDELQKHKKASDFSFGFSVFCENGRLVHVEGHKKILNFSKIEIVLLTKKGEISISGKELQIIEMRKGHLIVSGNITAILFEEKLK